MSLVSLNEGHPLHPLFSPTHEAKFCALCLLGFASDHIHTEPSGGEKLKPNFQKNFGFWNWLMHFLFEERTDEDVEDLFDRLERCSCNMREPNIRRYHQLGRASAGIIPGRVGVEKQRAPISLVVRFFGLLITALGQANIRSVAKRMSPIWPTCPNDLMPFGPDNLVQGFIRWSRFIPDTLGFRAACHVMRFCGPLVVPAFVSFRFTGYVIQAGRSLVDRTWDVIRYEKLRKRKEFAMPFVQQVEGILFYFESLDDEKIEVKLGLLDGYEYKSIQLFSLLEYLATDHRLLDQDCREDCNYKLVRRLEHCGTRFYNLARMAFENLPEILVFPGMFDNIEKYLDQDRKSALEFPEHNPESMTHEVSSEKFVEGETQEVEDITAELEASSVSDPAPDLSIQGSVLLPDNFDPDREYFKEISNKAFCFLRFAKDFLGCSAPSCPNFFSPSGPQAFPVCGKCNVVRYCGKPCQRNSWKHPDYPHKKVCEVMLELIEAGGGKDVVFQFQQLSLVDPALLLPTQRAVIDSWRRADVVHAIEYLIRWGLHLLSKSRCRHFISFDKNDEFTIAGAPDTSKERAVFKHLLTDATVFIRTAKFDLRCSAFACSNSIHTKGREFQRCVKCNVASYCGKTCQKKAWKDAVYPHKKVCLMLRRLTLFAGGEELLFRCTSSQDPAWFPPELQKEVHDNWERAGVSGDDLAYVVLWGTQLISESGPIPMRDEPGPGFEDYDALVREMGGSSGGCEAKPVIFFPYTYILPIVSREGRILEY